MNAIDLLAQQQNQARGGTVDRVFGLLRQGILKRRYAPGQRLVEADLTRDLGVSRGPLREAFRRLAAEGLIEMVPHRGAIVRRLTLRETIELFQIRTELESLAARLAAVNAADPCIRRSFEAAVAPIWRDEPRQPSDYTAENSAFHLAVIEASRNSQLDTITRQLQLPLIMLQVRRGLDSDVLWQSVEEHRRIAAAILDRDPAAAEKAMRGHLSGAARIAAEMHPDNDDSAAGSGPDFGLAPAATTW